MSGFALHVSCSKLPRICLVYTCVGLASATHGISPVGPKTSGDTHVKKKKKTCEHDSKLDVRGLPSSAIQIELGYPMIS